MITSAITNEGGGSPVPAAGPQGPSAYDVAVQNGFTGTVTQWLASLQGQTADPTALNAAVSRASVQADNAQASANAAAGSVVTATGILATITARITDAVSTAVATLTTALNAAVTSASNYATGAGQSAAAAAGSATTASGAVTSATTQASAASTSASASAGSATAAAGSATAAAGSATAAAASVTTAQKWAMQASGTVDGASYSAKYYAMAAAASAQTAAGGGITPGGPLTSGNFLAAGSGATAVDGGRIGSAAHLDVGTGSGGVAASDDSRITGAAQKSANLTDLPSPAVALAALGGVSTAALSAAIGSSAADLRYLFLRVAAMLNLSLGMVNGAVDPLSDLTHINTGASSGYTFSSSAGTIGPTPGSTSTVSSSTYAISSSDASGAPKTNAFNGVVSATDYWAPSEAVGAQANVSFIGQDFGAGVTKAITSIIYMPDTNDGGRYTPSLALQVADTSGGGLGIWTTVATYNPSGTASSTLAVPASAGSHRAWRLLATSNLSYTWAVFELTMQATAPTANMILQSTDFALGLTNPSKAQVLVQVDASAGAFTVNTDLTVSVSRCAGAQFTTGTLKLVETLPDGSKLYDTGQVDVSGQPSGNTGTMRVITANGKNIPLTGFIVLEAA